ncbi:MAG TPA: DUF1801 domain-containing protein [Ignavibacteria bacterium]|nr:DUF1801 domain-containing protein [Ignavibacteria bacterium]
MMQKAATLEEYIDSLSDERKESVNKLRKVISKNLPKGFKEAMSYGMIGYVVPHSLYPKGYHCDPKQPLPFICIASQKNYISLHHMGIYADTKLTEWFTSKYNKFSKAKLNMGKGCIKFSKPEHIPYDLIGELASKISPQKWIELYERAFRK